jgi:hypothetical protein
LDDRGSRGVCGREGDAEMEGGEDGEVGREGEDVGGNRKGGGEIGVVWDGEYGYGCVLAELDGDEKSEDRILV